ncbi:MAG: L,D-transpeptidase family protein [Anaerolineaceae bacterium]|nr:L,D-transpeptidase family protein [Anaerolineaceae bacterium]
MSPNRYSSSPAQRTQPVRVRQRAAVPHPMMPPQRRPANAAPRPQVSPGARRLPPRARSTRKQGINWWIAAPVIGVVVMMIATIGAALLGLLLVYAGGILPGVHAAGVAVGGMSQAEAVTALESQWDTITIRDGERTWAFNPGMFGITLDAQATAKVAYDQGRGQFSTALRGIFGQVDVPPVIHVDESTAEANLREFAGTFEQAPVNAGVRLVAGRVEATEPINGRVLDVSATVAQLRQDAGATLAKGELTLVMQTVSPTVTDATPMVEAASRLLANPFDVRIYDPVTGDSVYWSLPPEQWSAWLTADSAPDSPTGLALTASPAPVYDYLTAQASAVLDASRYIHTDEAVEAVQAAVSAGQTSAMVRVYHHDAQHTVQAGETIISIAWNYGVPYPWLQASNPGVGSLYPGQQITIPSADNFLDYEPVPDKRIVVSISQQHVWVYENGAVKWDWVASTGINDSPTWPGIYQIISHEPNAYAGNWNLWMPYFMGVYRPIPGADFTNGFHGFPTRGGGQILWTSNLGSKVTYGCIMLSDTNVAQLYNWAENGVVVEIRA